MANNKEIKPGDQVEVVISVWRKDEMPTVNNFYSGVIMEIVERTNHCFYVRVAGLDRLIPIDRVSA